MQLLIYADNHKRFAEKERLKALQSLKILDSQPEKEYDELTELAAYICDTPVALSA